MLNHYPKNCSLEPKNRWLLLGCNNSDKVCKVECEYKKPEKKVKSKFWKFWVK